jgi:hypothetical protein
MGNHEAEFLAKRGHKQFIKELSDAKFDPAEVADCAGEIGQFLCTTAQNWAARSPAIPSSKRA